jgi:hypothetical protein
MQKSFSSTKEVFLMKLCPDGALPKKKSFQSLADEAYQKIPPNG